MNLLIKYLLLSLFLLGLLSSLNTLQAQNSSDKLLCYKWQITWTESYTHLANNQQQRFSKLYSSRQTQIQNNISSCVLKFNRDGELIVSWQEIKEASIWQWLEKGKILQTQIKNREEDLQIVQLDTQILHFQYLNAGNYVFKEWYLKALN